MKNILNLSLLSAVLLFTSCQEWEPVFTEKYDDPKEEEIYELEANTSIAELKAMHVKDRGPVEITDDVMIAGQVTTSDQKGNLYKSLYIQDKTGGIEVKIGRNGLYNEYKVGQWIYVNCNGLTLGEYKGMKNLGFKSSKEKYETGYLEQPFLIDSHIFKGPMGEPVKPDTLSFSDVTKEENLGRLVTLQGLKYGNRVSFLFYINPNGDHTDYTGNCIFSDKKHSDNYGVNTWAASEKKFKEYLYDGCFDNVKWGPKGQEVTVDSTLKHVNEDGSVTYDIGSSAYAIGQIFEFGSTPIQIRTSGYAKFSDYKLDKSLPKGTVDAEGNPEFYHITEGDPIDVTGILTIYRDDYQMTLIDLNGIQPSK